MIFFFQNGRLGNQLFQYSGLRSLFPGEKILLIGLDDLRSSFEINDASFIRLPSSGCLVSVLRKLIGLALHYRLFSEIREIYNSENGYNSDTKKGIIPIKIAINNCFFQSLPSHGIIRRFPVIKKNIYQQAHDWFIENSIDPVANIEKNVFLHIRRGDYLHWPAQDYPAVLSLEWVNHAIEYVCTKITNPCFIVVTDDIQYTKDVFGRRRNFILSETNNAALDFVLMTMCGNGIMSASSFSLAAMLYSAERRSKKSIGIYVAPQYWLGHSKGAWLPVSIQEYPLLYI